MSPVQDVKDTPDGMTHAGNELDRSLSCVGVGRLHTIKVRPVKIVADYPGDLVDGIYCRSNCWLAHEATFHSFLCLFLCLV